MINIQQTLNSLRYDHDRALESRDQHLAALIGTQLLMLEVLQEVQLLRQAFLPVQETKPQTGDQS